MGLLDKSLIARISKENAKRGLFVIPNPTKDAASKRKCKQWITNLKNGMLCFETYVYNTS